MNVNRPRDAVDDILDQWRQERPELDLATMGTVGRLKRSAVLVQRALEATFARFGLTLWEFDVLATLRRSGAPYCLAPTVLFSTLMVTSGTMTHRLKRLEASGWVTRCAHEQDARSLLVQLTSAGFELVEQAVEAHLDNERRILAGLSATEQQVLDGLLSKMLLSLEAVPVQSPNKDG